MRAQKYAIISDIHVPFHDKKVWSKVLRCIDDETVDGIVINGDFMDLYSLGRYNADSVRLLSDITLWDEYEAGRKALADVEDILPRGAKKHFLYGNHEDRYFRELDRGDRGKYGVALNSPTEALRLEEKGWEVKDNWKQDYVLLGSHLEVTHGIYCTVHSAKKHLDEFQGSVLFGHSHRFQSFVLGKRGAWNVGFLGDLHSRYFHYTARTTRSRWVQSFAFVYIMPDGSYHTRPIQIYDGTFIHNGKVY